MHRIWPDRISASLFAGQAGIGRQEREAIVEHIREFMAMTLV